MARKAAVADVWTQMDAVHLAEKLSSDDGFTVSEYATRYGLSSNGAYVRLQKMVANGTLLVGSRKGVRARLAVYRFPVSD